MNCRANVVVVDRLRTPPGLAFKTSSQAQKLPTESIKVSMCESIATNARCKLMRRCWGVAAQNIDAQQKEAGCQGVSHLEILRTLAKLPTLSSSRLPICCGEGVDDVRDSADVEAVWGSTIRKGELWKGRLASDGAQAQCSNCCIKKRLEEGKTPQDKTALRSEHTLAINHLGGSNREG